MNFRAIEDLHLRRAELVLVASALRPSEEGVGLRQADVEAC
jgi:hypothetical protein